MGLCHFSANQALLREASIQCANGIPRHQLRQVSRGQLPVTAHLPAAGPQNEAGRVVREDVDNRLTTL
jgi:hypothetical protein